MFKYLSFVFVLSVSNSSLASELPIVDSIRQDIIVSDCLECEGGPTGTIVAFIDFLCDTESENIHEILISEDGDKTYVVIKRKDTFQDCKSGKKLQRFFTINTDQLPKNINPFILRNPKFIY